MPASTPPAFVEAIETAVTALTLAAPAAARLAVGVTDLAGLLALARHRLRLGCVAGDRPRSRRHPARPGGGSVRCAGAAVRQRGAGDAGLASSAWRDAIAWAGRSGARRPPGGHRRGGPAAHRADGDRRPRSRGCVAWRRDRRHRTSLFAARHCGRSQPYRPSLAGGKWHHRRDCAGRSACRRRSASRAKRRRTCGHA